MRLNKLFCSLVAGILLFGQTFFSISYGRDIPCQEYLDFANRPRMLTRIASTLKRSSSNLFSKKGPKALEGTSSRKSSSAQRDFDDTDSSNTSNSNSQKGSPSNSQKGSPTLPHFDEEPVIQVESSEDEDSIGNGDPCPVQGASVLTNSAKDTMSLTSLAVGGSDDKEDKKKKALFVSILRVLKDSKRKLNDIRDDYRQGIQYPDLWSCVISQLSENRDPNSKMESRKELELSSIFNDLITPRAGGVTIDLGNGPVNMAKYYSTQSKEKKDAEIFVELVKNIAEKLEISKANTDQVAAITFKDHKDSMAKLPMDNPHIKLALGILYSATQNTLNTYNESLGADDGKFASLPHGNAAPISFSIQLEREPYVQGSGFIPYKNLKNEPVEDRLLFVKPQITNHGLVFDYRYAVLKPKAKE